MKDLEEAFSLTTSKPSSQPTSPTQTRKQAVSSLLDITRAQNIGIMLSRIKLSFPDIRRALLEIDDRQLSADDLKAISKHLPTDDEVGRLKDFADIGKLAKADQYFSEIMTISRLSQRLECILYRRRLEMDMEEVRPELEMLRSAGSELRTSLRFKKVLQTVLAIGNALNGSTFRGGARGFQLDALMKLKETKTANADPSCPTLLHYLARVLLRSDPSLVLFIEDLPHAESAARVSVQTVIASANSIYAGLEQLKNEIIVQRKSSTPGDKFVQVMEPFVKLVGGTVVQLKEDAASVDMELKSLLAYYGEVPDGNEGLKPEDFFGLVMSFSSALQKASVEVHAAEPRKLVSIQPETSTVDEVDEEEPQESNTLKKKPSAQQLLAPPGMPASISSRKTIGRGDLDEAIRSIRVGQRPRARGPNRPLSKIFLDGSSPGRPTSSLFDA